MKFLWSKKRRDLESTRTEFDRMRMQAALSAYDPAIGKSIGLDRPKPSRISISDLSYRDPLPDPFPCDCPDCTKDNIREFTDRTPDVPAGRFTREEKYNPYMPAVKGQAAVLDMGDKMDDKFIVKHPQMTRQLVAAADNAYFMTGGVPVPEGKEGNLIASSVEGQDWHLPIFDLDFPCELVPSQTENHYHLFMSKPVSWEGYVNVMWAMAEAGLLNRGWVACSIAQKFCALRPTLSHVVEEMRTRIAAGENPSDVLASLDTKISGSEERTYDGKTKNPCNQVPF